MQITLARALKEKNRIVGEINALKSIFSRENSRVETEGKAQRSRQEIWDNITKRTEDLIALKAKIATANVDIYPLIEKMSELKGRVTYVQGLNTLEGVEEPNQYQLARNPNAKAKTISAHFNITTVDQLVAALQKEIGDLQDKIDEFNATHRIEL